MARLIVDGEKLKNMYSGLGQFCLHLGHALVQQEISDLCFYVPKEQEGIFGKQVKYLQHRSLHKITGIKTHSSDLFHATHQTSKYLPTNKATPYILTVHDLNFLYKYSGAKLKRKKKALQYKINRARAITAISHFAAQELKENMDLNGKHITVIHNGNSLNTTIAPVKPAWINDRPFLFTIGIVLPRKNFHVLIPFVEQLKHYSLVIAGNADSAYAGEIKKTIKDRNIEDRVFLPGNITDAEKLWLYQNCSAFVFPSLAEGFGLPVVEAMSLGKPVFLNHGTSLPEVGGKDAFYWHNFDAAQMKEVFEKGMQYFSSHDLAQKYMRHAEQFTWTHAAHKYAEVYRQVLQH